MSSIDKLSSLLAKLNLSEENLSELNCLVKDLKREDRKKDFMIERLGKDKTIMTNFLNTSIQELEVQKKMVEEHSDLLKANLKELRHAYDEVEQFSYIASHDLKSPLRTISSFVQLLQRKFGNDLTDEQAEYCAFINKGVVQMDSVISDLLKYSRVGNKSAEIQSTDFNEVIDVVRFNLKELMDTNNAKIILSNVLPVLKVQKTTIIQLFQNLIGNAIKFRSDKIPIVEVCCQQLDKKKWEFQVKDNGVGMDKDEQKRAFLPFQRLNNQDRPGTGIGLAICKKAVKLHDGTIAYESEKGVGTTFIFTISEPIHLSVTESKLQLVG